MAQRVSRPGAELEAADAWLLTRIEEGGLEDDGDAVSQIEGVEGEVKSSWGDRPATRLAHPWFMSRDPARCVRRAVMAAKEADGWMPGDCKSHDEMGGAVEDGDGDGRGNGNGDGSGNGSRWEVLHSRRWTNKRRGGKSNSNGWGLIRQLRRLQCQVSAYSTGALPTPQKLWTVLYLGTCVHTERYPGTCRSGGGAPSQWCKTTNEASS